MVNNLFDHPGYIKAIRDDLLGFTTKPHNIIWSDDIRNQYVLDAKYLTNVQTKLNLATSELELLRDDFENNFNTISDKFIFRFGNVMCISSCSNIFTIISLYSSMCTSV